MHLFTNHDGVKLSILIVSKHFIILNKYFVNEFKAIEYRQTGSEIKQKASVIFLTWAKSKKLLTVSGVLLQY